MAVSVCNNLLEDILDIDFNWNIFGGGSFIQSCMGVFLGKNLEDKMAVGKGDIKKARIFGIEVGGKVEVGNYQDNSSDNWTYIILDNYLIK